MHTRFRFINTKRTVNNQVDGPFLYVFYPLQVDGAKSRISGTISKRPQTMEKEKTSLEKSLKSAKLHLGPTEARPGPMLLKVAATELKVVVKSRFSKEISTKSKMKVPT